MAEFTNQATLTFNGTTVNSNIVTGEIVNTISASKIAINDDYSLNDRITYAISIVNGGNTSYNDLTVRDNLGAYEFIPTGTTAPIILYPLDYVENSAVYYLNGILQANPTVTVNDGITITNINIPAGSNATIIYQAVTNEFAPTSVNGEIFNAGDVSGDGIVGPLDFSAVISAAQKADLSIFKSLTPRFIPENGQLTYTFDISNIGNTAADSAAQVKVTDIFDPILTNIRVYLNGNLLSTSDYSYDELNGVFSTNAGAIKVPAAIYDVNSATGAIGITPGVATLEIIGTV